MRDAGHRTADIRHRTAEKAKIIYPPPRGVDIMRSLVNYSRGHEVKWAEILEKKNQ